MNVVKSAVAGVSLSLISSAAFSIPLVVDFNELDVAPGIYEGTSGGLSVHSGGCHFTSNGSGFTGVENGVDGPDNGTPHLFGSSIDMDCGAPFNLLSWDIGSDGYDLAFDYFVQLDYQDGSSATIEHFVDNYVFNPRSTGLGGNLISATWYTTSEHHNVPFQFALDNIAISTVEASVPEPGTLALLGLGLLGLGAARRRG